MNSCHLLLIQNLMPRDKQYVVKCKGDLLIEVKCKDMGDPKMESYYKDANNLKIKGDLDNKGVGNLEVRGNLEYKMEGESNLEVGGNGKYRIEG